MIRRIHPAFVFLALCILALSAGAQVMLIGGGTSTIAKTEGAGATLYEQDATTQTSLGYAQGFHLGVARQVRTGSTLLTMGDSSLPLILPTDMAGAGRSIAVRGVTLEQTDARQQDSLLSGFAPTMPGKPSRFTGRAFAGWAGNSYRNNFFSTVQPSSPIALAQGDVRLDHAVDVSALAIQGQDSSVLASAAWTPSHSSSAAVTAGWTAGHPVFRLHAQTSRNGWEAETSYTSGTMRLQPDPLLANLSIERIGWNGTLAKRLGNWLFLDVSRHEYDTGSAQDSASSGVTAAKSTLYEGGATVRVGHAEAGVRGLRSASGAQISSGLVYIAAWNSPRWSARATTTEEFSTANTSMEATSLDGSEQVCPHLRLTQSATFASGTPGFDFGGAYENRFGSFTVSHHETFIPFGTDAGFHRVLSIGIHVHLGKSEIAVDQISGHGLNPVYDVNVNGFYGDTLGQGGAPSSTMPSLPKYAVYGTVTNAEGTPVRGAAVKAGSQTVYTDSEGRFAAQFTKSAPVRVAVSTAQFLTAENYEALTEPASVVPATPKSGTGLVLRVKRCNACNEPVQQPLAEPDAPLSGTGSQHHWLKTVGARLLHLASRMVRVVPAHRHRIDAADLDQAV